MSKNSNAADSLISKSELDQWAQQDAHNDNAKGAEDEFPSFEGRTQQIVQTYTAIITKIFVNKFKERTDELRTGFHELTGRLINDPKTYVLNVVNQINTAIATADKQCAPKITDLQHELSDWEARFKSGFHNGIANPKKQNVIWHWGVILFLLAIEVILNSRFFAETSEYGLLGGTMAAVTVSIVNVGIPILVGFFTHKLFFGKNNLLKWIGIFLLILLIVFAAVFNYEVAEYRDRLLTSAEKAASSMPEYFALLAIGGAIALISFWKMFSFMDPYLRPRRCHQNLESTIADYENIALKSIKEAQYQVGETLKDVATRVDNTDGAIQGEKANFEFRCSETIGESNKMIGYYHLKYCPIKVDPDPEMPELSSLRYDFASAQSFVEETLANLEQNCKKANDEWKPLLQETIQKLVSTHQKFQAVVVANIQAAVAKAK